VSELFDKKTILVTGAGGYIGSTLVPLLIDQGYRVIALDRFFFGREKLRPHKHLRIVAEDARRIQPELLSGVYGVIDLAAISNDPAGERFKVATRSINYNARVRLAEMSKHSGVSRYILPSSCSVYGCSNQVLDESSPTNALTEYARAAVDAESEVLPMEGSDFSVVVVRQATVFGYSPRMRFDLVVNAMVHDAWKTGTLRMMGSGHQKRPFVHVQDACSAMIRILQADTETVGGEIFNVGSDRQNLSIQALSELIRAVVYDATHRSLNVVSYGSEDHRNYQVDFGKIESRLSWRPSISIEDGCRAIISELVAGRTRKKPDTMTLDWYEMLERMRPAEALMYGGILSIE
jgi:nucleoside-diphosphate-sugar epimerase